uniref:Ig-like domain-containing protein n=3 Tax=Gasterosteus aculeatus TaxID=69293 RepID=G3PKP9_GASAC
MSESKSFGLFVGFLLCATGASCPIELSPPSVVVRYGDPVSINCSTSDGHSAEMGWEATVGSTIIQNVPHVAWTVERLIQTDYDVTSICFYNPPSGASSDQCSKTSTVVVYTFPETIGISGPGGVMVEGETCQFTCDVPNIAPVQNLTVKWYKGDAMIHEDTFKNVGAGKKPVNQSSVLNFTATRQDNGLTVRCEAHLDLRPNGPQLNASSQELKVTVHFGPEGECLSLDKLELQEGDTLGGRCPMTGRPE